MTLAMCSDVETIANFNHRPLYRPYGVIWRVVFWLASMFLDSAIYWEHDRVSKHSAFDRERTFTVTLKMSTFAGMTKHFNLGSGRVLLAQKKGSVYKTQDLRNWIGQSIRWLLNREMGFIRPRYRRCTECYLWDPYQSTAKVSSSHRWRLLHLCVCRLQICWYQVKNCLFCFTKYY